MAKVRQIGAKKIKSMPKASAQQLPKYTPKRGQYVDPNSFLYAAMTKEERITEFKRSAKVAERRLRYIEEKGLKEKSLAYRIVEQSGETRRSGAIGFSTAGINNMNASELKKRQIQVYNFLQRESSHVTTDSVRKMEEEYLAEQLAKQGIDYEEMLAPGSDRRRYKDELEEFYYLYGQARKLGLFKEFNITNHYEQEAVISTFLAANPNLEVKSKRSATNIISNAMRKVDIVNSLSMQNNSVLKDDYRKAYFRDNYDSKKMKSLSSSLLRTITVHTYGMTPPKSHISFDPNRFKRK